MSTSFTPPRPDQWEGPTQAFTPPPVSSWQGPAKPEELSPIAKTGKAFAEGTGLTALKDIVSGLSGDPAAVARSKEALQGLVQGIAHEPGRIWDELSRTGEAMLKADPSGTAYHLAGAVPLLGAGAQQVAHDLQRGDPAAAVGHTGALVAPFLVGPAARATGRGLRALPDIAEAAGAGVKAAAPDLVKGTAKLGVGYAASKLPLPAEVKYGIGIPSTAIGARQIGQGLKKGIGAARASFADRGPSLPPTVEVVPPEVIPPERQLTTGDIITPAPADTSGIVPGAAQYAQREPIPPERQLPPGPELRITPPPADTSYVRGVPGEYPTVEPTPVPAANPQPGIIPGQSVTYIGDQPAVMRSPEAAGYASQLAEELQRPVEPAISAPPAAPPATEPVVPKRTAEEATAYNRTNKRQPFVDFVREAGYSAEDADKIERGRWSPAQIDQGMTPKWGNITDALIEKGLLKEGVKEPSAITVRQIVQQLKTDANKAKLTPEIIEPVAKGIGSLQENLQTIGDEALDRVRKSGTFQGRTLPSLFPAEVTKDMVTWGAARIANGAIDFAKWSKAMLADAKDISPEAVAKVSKMLPDLFAKAQKEYEHHVETIGPTLADLPTIMKYYRAGKEGKDWYSFVKPAMQPLFGQNTDLFLKMLAATSPNTKVTQNVTNAIKAYRQFASGQPFQGFMQAHLDNLNRAVADVPMSGPKVGAFGPNLLGDLNPVTVDIWMARALFGRDTPTALQFKLGDYMTSQAAKKVGLKPAEMQAAIWTGIKKLTKSRDTAAPPEVIIQEYLDKNPNVRKLFEDSLQMSPEQFKELQAKQAPAKPPR